MHTCIHTSTMHTHMHTHIHHAYTHAYTHPPCIHTCIHTYSVHTLKYSKTSLIRSSFIRIPRHPDENRWLPIYSICHAYIQTQYIRFPHLSGYFWWETDVCGYARSDCTARAPRLTRALHLDFTARERKTVWQSATKFVRCENLSVLRSR